jgi:hypothetical protein
MSAISTLKQEFGFLGQVNSDLVYTPAVGQTGATKITVDIKVMEVYGGKTVIATNTCGCGLDYCIVNWITMMLL